MVPAKAALFELLSARLRWLGQRQVVLGQNIANADTPEYRPRDLSGAAFAQLVERQAGQPSKLPLETTHGGHLGSLHLARIDLSAREEDTTFEIAPNGNAVVLEEQMAKMAETALAHQLTNNLYGKYLGMVRTALGTHA